MARLAALSIIVILGFRGFEGWEGLTRFMGPLASYSPPVVFGMAGLGVAAVVRTVRATHRHAALHVPAQVPLLVALVAVYVITWLMDVSLGGGSPRATVVILELVVGVTFMVTVYASFRTVEDVRLLQRAVFFAAIGVASYLLYRATFLPEPAVRLGTFSRANYADLAYLIAAAMWIGPISRFILPIPWRWGWSLVQVGILLGAALLTGTRAGIWTVLMFAPLLLLVMRRVGGRGTVHTFWFIPATLILGWALVSLLSTRAVVSRGLELFAFNRGDVWLYAWEEGTADVRSLLIGAGTGSYHLPGGITYPHNLLLEVQFNGGLIATAVIATAVGLSLVRTWRLLRADDQRPELQALAVPAIGLGTVATIGALITYEMPSNLLLWVYLAMAGRLQLLSEMRQPRSTAPSRVTAPGTLIPIPPSRPTPPLAPRQDTTPRRQPERLRP